MKKKLFLASLIYIYIYSVTPQNAYAIKDATSFDPEPIKVGAKNHSVPIGTVIVWTKNKIPEGWLECNGQAVNQDLYPDLFALMHNTPNYQGYFLRGLGGNSDKLGVEQGDAIRNIEGSMTLVDGGILSHTGVFNAKPKTRNHIIASAPSWSSSEYEFDASRVVPTANENRPINKAVKYIIKAE